MKAIKEISAVAGSSWDGVHGLPVCEVVVLFGVGHFANKIIHGLVCGSLIIRVFENGDSFILSAEESRDTSVLNLWSIKHQIVSLHASHLVKEGTF